MTVILNMEFLNSTDATMSGLSLSMAEINFGFRRDFLVLPV